MKTNFLVCLCMLFLIACTEQPANDAAPEAAGTPTTAQAATALPTDTTTLTAEEDLAAKWRECEAYFASMRLDDSERITYLDRVLAEKQSKLTGNNRRFLEQLRDEFTNKAAKKPRLTIEQALFAVFRIPDQKLGIIGHHVPDMDRPSEFIDLSLENTLLRRWVGPQWGQYNEAPRMVHYPELLDSLYPGGKPQVYLYTTKATRTTRVKELGHYRDECSEYYHYTFDERALQAGDELLFGSRIPLDLTYENNPGFDAWYRTDLKPECADCPSSHDKALSVAKLTGTQNLYFIYSDAFPDNRELHTPFRALVTKLEDGRTMYLWYSDVDNFGCSCV